VVGLEGAADGAGARLADRRLSSARLHEENTAVIFHLGDTRGCESTAKRADASRAAGVLEADIVVIGRSGVRPRPGLGRAGAGSPRSNRWGSR